MGGASVHRLGCCFTPWILWGSGGIDGMEVSPDSHQAAPDGRVILWGALLPDLGMIAPPLSLWILGAVVSPWWGLSPWWCCLSSGRSPALSIALAASIPLQVINHDRPPLA